MSNYTPEDLEHRANSLDASGLRSAAVMLRAGAQAMRDLEAAQARVKELQALLKKLEFMPSLRELCPICNGWNCDPGLGATPHRHTKDCQLAAALQAKP